MFMHVRAHDIVCVELVSLGGYSFEFFFVNCPVHMVTCVHELTVKLHVQIFVSTYLARLFTVSLVM